MAVIKGIAAPAPDAGAAASPPPATLLVRLKSRSIEEPGCITREPGYITTIPAAHFDAQHHELVNPPTAAPVPTDLLPEAGEQSSVDPFPLNP